MNIYKDRIEKIRELMSDIGATFYLVLTADPHHSEYINNYYKEREYLSGFTGSNGTLLIGLEDAYLWTDGRYFVQAANELEGSDIILMKSLQKGVPTIAEFLSSKMSFADKLVLDGNLISAELGIKYRDLCSSLNARFETKNLVDLIWNDRPSIKYSKIWHLNNTGEDTLSKINRVREYMHSVNAEYFFLSKLDDIMWLFNIRANDIECNPVAFAYAVIGAGDAFIYLNENAYDNSDVEILKKYGVTIKLYSHIYEDIQRICSKKSVLLDISNINYASYDIFSVVSNVISKPNCTELYKAIKNEIEIKNSIDCYLKDSVVLTKFIKYIKSAVKTNDIYESEAAAILDNMRAKIPGFIELSFPTISAYGANAAMMHYEAVKGSDSLLKPMGIYLVDSGATYENGTTDVTRSIVLGDVSDEVKMHFTKVCAGMLRLLNARFMQGCTGRNLDILARGPLWDIGIDYKCGTGHGVGYILNVHEGPHSIRFARRSGEEETVLVPGMIMSNEPGVYIENSHGIRTENIMLCEHIESNDDGDFLGFKCLTLVPIDLDGIDIRYLNSDDISNLNSYHKLVFESLSPHFEGEELEWLKNATRAI